MLNVNICDNGSKAHKLNNLEGRKHRNLYQILLKYLRESTSDRLKTRRASLQDEFSEGDLEMAFPNIQLATD